jgi:hypothetical protein
MDKPSKIATTAALCIVFFLGFIYTALLVEMKAIDISRETIIPFAKPALLLLFVGFAMSIWYLVLRAKELNKNNPYAREVAEKLTQTEWYVKGVRVGHDMVELTLHTADHLRQRHKIFFPSAHPDYKQAAELGKLEKMKFEFTPEPIEGGANETVFLRIKEAVKFV